MPKTNQKKIKKSTPQENSTPPSDEDAIQQFVDMGLSVEDATILYKSKQAKEKAKQTSEKLQAEKDEYLVSSGYNQIEEQIDLLKAQLQSIKEAKPQFFSGRGGKISTTTDEQKAKKRERAQARKEKAEAGEGVKCKCGKTFVKENHFYRKCMEKCSK
tara:strand:- start:521 stop:994 length:474 start_codon:yes stop_codon:yes gene_type:complete